MPHIDVRIPWEPGRKLAAAYTRIIESVSGWVLILDADVMLGLTNGWYDECQRAIDTLGERAGWITCRTNRIGCALQKHPEYEGDDLNIHRNIANALYCGRRGTYQDVTDASGKLSGFFMLSHKAALSSILPLPDKFLGLDNWIGDRLKEKGYRLYVMEGLYVYHGYKRLWK
jgi:GT2 family glycosyltransferase